MKLVTTLLAGLVASTTLTAADGDPVPVTPTPVAPGTPTPVTPVVAPPAAAPVDAVVVDDGDAHAGQRSWTGNVNGFVGFKALDEDDWDPIENHAEFGVHFDIRPRSWPISLAANLLISAGGHEDEDGPSDVETVGSTSELQLGVKKIWDIGDTAHWYLAGGVTFVTAAFEVDTGGIETDDEGDGVGLWLGTGVYWTLGGHFNIGPSIAISGAEVELEDSEEDIEAGGLHAGVLLGYAF